MEKRMDQQDGHGIFLWARPPAFDPQNLHDRNREPFLQFVLWPFHAHSWRTQTHRQAHDEYFFNLTEIKEKYTKN